MSEVLQLKKQNFMLAKIAAIGLYFAPLLGIAFWAVVVNTAGRNGGTVTDMTKDIVFGTSLGLWGACVGVTIYSFGRYAENFLEERKYWLYLKIGILGLFISWICLMYLFHYEMRNVGHFILIVVAIACIFCLLYGFLYFKSQSDKDDFVGGLDDVMYYAFGISKDIREFLENISIRVFPGRGRDSRGYFMYRSFTLFPLPYYLYLMFKYAQWHAEEHGFAENRRKDDE